MIRARKIAEDLHLKMKIGDVEYQGDGNKAIFYYIADERVDFRQLIKVLADAFKVRIEMKQIGARQEAGPHRGYRAVRTSAVLLKLDDLVCVGGHECGAVSGYIAESSETCRPVRQAEVLPEF